VEHTPELTRRQALRLLLGAAVIGAGACTSRPGKRESWVRPSASTTTTLAPTTTTTLAPTTTTTVPPTTTSTAPATTTTTTEPPPTPAPPAEPHPSGAQAGFVAFGDFGGGLDQGAVAQAMTRWAAGHRVDALVTTGDNVYDYGEPAFFAAYLDQPYQELRATRPMWVTLGNHDVMRGHGDAQLAHLGLPALPYTTVLNGVRLFFLDSNRPDAAQAAWLDEQLAQPGPACSVVVFHAPLYSCGTHGNEASVVAAWGPVLEGRKVTLVLNGHDHLYQRFASAAGVTYVVTGGGGRDLYPHTPGCNPPELRFSAVRHHFTGVEVFADRLVISAVGTDDSVFDRLEIPLPALVGS
jgi:hypothetical protein